MYDVVLRGGTIIDGTRMPRYRGDVGIVDGRIAALGRLADSEALRVIDAEGLIVAPGFVDLHVHGYGGHMAEQLLYFRRRAVRY